MKFLLDELKLYLVNASLLQTAPFHFLLFKRNIQNRTRLKDTVAQKKLRNIRIGADSENDD